MVLLLMVVVFSFAYFFFLLEVTKKNKMQKWSTKLKKIIFTRKTSNTTNLLVNHFTHANDEIVLSNMVEIE